MQPTISLTLSPGDRAGLPCKCVCHAAQDFDHAEACAGGKFSFKKVVDGERFSKLESMGCALKFLKYPPEN